MKTSIYNKEQHIEGYTGSGKTNEKSNVQKEYEKGNDSNEVTAFGKETIEGDDLNGPIKGNTKARDGFDNTGTQGKDSLNDDTYRNGDGNSATKSTIKEDNSIEDIKLKQRDEDDVLNTGI